MRTINRIFCSLLLAGACSLGAIAQENQSYFLHTIEKGQSLYSISSMYGVSQADIIRLNPGCDEKIYAGQTIKIPQKKTAQQSEIFHTIQAGETLYKLTIVYNISAKAICEANPHKQLPTHKSQIMQTQRKQPIRFKALFSPDAKRCTK